jgi:hypothetical protein
MTKKRNAVRRQLVQRAGDIVRNLKEFAESEAVFCSESLRLIDQYENSWIGVYRGRVAASGKILGSLKLSLKAKGIPPPQTMIRRIDREREP